MVDNNGFFCDHLLTELITFYNDLFCYDYSVDFQERIKKEMELAGYGQPPEKLSIVTNKGIIDILFRTEGRENNLVLLEQRDNSDQQPIIEKTRRLIKYIEKKSAARLLKKYHSESYSYKVDLKEEKDGGGQVVREPMINVAWMGRLSSDNQIVLRDFVDNLLDVFQGTICIQLLDSIEDDVIDLSSFDERVKIEQYLGKKGVFNSKIDLCVTTQERVLLPSLLGIVTIIRPDYQTRYRNDRYIYSYDLDKIGHVVDHHSLSKEGIQVKGIRDVLFDIYCNKNGTVTSDNCRKYAFNTLSLGLELVKCKGIKRTKLLSNKVIRTVYNQFLSYHEETHQSYMEFLIDNNLTVERKVIDEKDDWKREQNYQKRDDYSLEELLEIQKNYTKKVEVIRTKTKIRVAFLVMFKQSFSSVSLFKRMINDDAFDPFIIVVPNVLRSMVYQNNLYKDTFESLKERFGNRVLHGYIERLNHYVDIKDDYDIIVFSNPYDIYEHPFHNVKHFEKRNVLPICVNYGWLITRYSDEMVSLNFFGSIWKYLLETDYHLNYYKEKSIIGGINGILTGYVKMDDLFYEKKNNRDRKVIIIAPHHTVADDPIISLSNFIRYSEFFLELPHRYPEVDFIFRPHPLLFTHLKANKIWDEVRIEDYLRKLESIPNIYYDRTDYYFDKFINSDAIIHDCGSFIAEYLYTNKPCCYMIKDQEQLNRTLLPFAQDCLDCYYKAFNENDIIDFIDNVVLNEIDPLKDKRINYSKDKLMVNYPHASDYFIDYLKGELKQI